MRIRTIKPEFWESESLGRVSREARLLFIGLFSMCDDSGRSRASSRFLASQLFPYDDDAKGKISKWLDELAREKCIRLYEVDGDHFLDIPKWLSHQRIDHPTQSKHPQFASVSESLANPREESSSPRAGMEGNGREGKGTGKRVPAAQFVYPPELDTPDFRKAWEDRCRCLKSKLNADARDAQMERCVKMGYSRALSAVEHSLNYQGLFEPNGAKPPASPLRPEERRDSLYPKAERFSNCSTKGCTAPDSEIVKHPVRGSLICKSCLAKEQANAVRS